MATDGLSLYATIYELTPLIGSRIDKIQQPDKDMLIFHLHGLSCGRVRLMINIHNENGRIQLTSQIFDNPDNPPPFCMILRKYLVGSKIASINQLGMDRIVSMEFVGRNELKDEINLQLIIELMGKHGNVFLLDSQNKILDCMRHFGINEESVRICLPNCHYTEPPHQDARLYPFNLNKVQLTLFSKGRHPREWMQGNLLGISKLCAEQICSSFTKPDRIGDECYEVLSNLFHHSFTPSVIPDRGVLPFIPKNAKSITYNSMCEAQEAFYRSKDEKAIISKKRSNLRSCVEHARKRVSHKIETQSFHITNEESANQLKRYGELLLSNLQTAKCTADSALVTDYYSDPPSMVTVPIDRKYSVKQNADLYFKKYHKSKAAREYALSQVDLLQSERNYLESILVAIEQCTTCEELNEIREELISQGYLRPITDRKSFNKRTKSEPYKYLSPSGSTIIVGKNNFQNDRLLKAESADYYWFHVKNNPGSHVYLEESLPSPETMLFAAQIAVFHSKASSSSNVPVDYTLHKFIKKPSGARPGYVIYTNQHTVYVTPDPDTILKNRIDS